MKKSFSVWRNGTLVGEFDEVKPIMHHGKPSGSSGVLRPTAIPADIGDGVWQVRMELMPGNPVMESPMERMVVPFSTEAEESAPGPRGPRLKVSASAPLREASAQEPLGIPAERIFSVRGGDGSDIRLRMFSIHAHEWVGDGPPPEWFGEGGDSTARLVWLVSIFLDDGSA